MDLHIHTNKSDGILSAFEVITLAKEKGISIISITDHDTIDAYADDVLEYARKNGIILIPGVEISTKINKCGIHVLGYNFDLNDNVLKEELKNIRNARRDYLYSVSNKLSTLGYNVNTEYLDTINSVTKAHIANDIINNESNRQILMDTFGHIPNKGEFIENIMNEGCPAYVKKNTITPDIAVKIIKNSKGKVVLAHPVAYSYEDDLNENDILKIVNENDINAIEGNYLYVDKNNNVHNDIDKWNTFAKKHNLISTVGSDFHVEDKLRPSIGYIKINKDNETDILEYLLGR